MRGLTSGYLLGNTAGLAEWMIDVLASDYAASIHGTHGFGLRHPRAPWLTLVVSDREECACGELARWEEQGVAGFCPRCAEAEIALAAAEIARVRAMPRLRLVPYESGPTSVEPYATNAQLMAVRS